MNAKNSKEEDLLKNQRVVEEINRHLWIESEKAGCDIGFEKAKADWLNRFSKAWMAYHMPEALTKPEVKAEVKPAPEKKAEKPAAPSKRRAKSYLF